MTIDNTTHLRNCVVAAALHADLPWRGLFTGFSADFESGAPSFRITTHNADKELTVRWDYRNDEFYPRMLAWSWPEEDGVQDCVAVEEELTIWHALLYNAPPTTSDDDLYNTYPSVDPEYPTLKRCRAALSTLRAAQQASGPSKA